MEIVYSTFIGMISSKIAWKIVGTCLDVVFSRNVKKSTISIFKGDFFQRIPRGPRRLACPFRGASAESINPFFFGFECRLSALFL